MATIRKMKMQGVNSTDSIYKTMSKTMSEPDEDVKAYEPIELLEMNWSKIKDELSEIAYEEILTDAIKKWMQYDSSDRASSILKHEGFLDTKRKNSLNNLLDENEDNN